MLINNFLHDRFTNDIVLFIDKTKNTNLQKFILNTILKFDPKSKKEKLIDLSKNCHYLTEENYNKSININRSNVYTVLKFPIKTSESLKEMAKQCLENIVKSQKILVNNKKININDCIIVDICNTSKGIFSGFHTDFMYSNFTGNAFNVWYLIENNQNYGNMFLLESDEYKKKYTPCFLDYNSKDNLIPLCRNSYTDVVKSIFPFIKESHIGYLNEDRVKMTYTNIKNSECIVMSKHLLHRGDEKRKNNVRGFHFRVLVKNEDGSIDYNNHYKPSDKFPNHRWDQKNKKLYGVEFFDFV
jgi:hypothetical protein